MSQSRGLRNRTHADTFGRRSRAGQSDSDQDSMEEEYVTVQMWGGMQGCMVGFGAVIGLVSLLVVGLGICMIYFWVEEYPGLKDDVCYVKENCCNQGYDAENNMCTDLEASAAIGCMANVDETGVSDLDILVYSDSSGEWTPLSTEEACPALCMNGTNGTNGGDGNDGNNCWDINGNGLCDLQIEDVNNDGVCNQTDCIGNDGSNGMDGANATIDECDKPFGQLYYANGTSPGDATPFVLVFASADVWVPHTGLECQTSAENFINATNPGCLFTVINNDSYKIQVDVSFATTMPPGAEIWVGVSIDGATPLLHNSFSVHSGQQDTLSFTLALALVTGDTITLQYYSKNNTGSLDIDRIQFTAVGELLCGFDVTGPQGPQGLQGSDGGDGYHCWDTNQNYFCDLATEDVNNDGVCNVSDCVLQNITYDVISGDICPELDSASIDCIGDVQVTGASGGQVLVFNSTSSVWENDNFPNAAMGMITIFTTSSTFVVPSGVTTIRADLMGGGGSGGSTQVAGFNTNSGSGAGGGASAYQEEMIFVVIPGSTLTITVGSGGIAIPSIGVDGTASTVMQGATVLAVANGGNKGEGPPGQSVGGDGGSGAYAGGGGGEGTEFNPGSPDFPITAVPGTAGISLYGIALNAIGRRGAHGAPGILPGSSEFSAGAGGVISFSPAASAPGSGGGGGATSKTPDHVNLPLVGKGGDGGESLVSTGPGDPGQDATRYGAGGGGASGGWFNNAGANGGSGADGYVRLVY